MMDVAVRILEPCELEVAGLVDIAFASDLRQAIVVLKGHSLRPEGLHDVVEIAADAPGDGRGLVRSGELRGIHNERGAAALVSDHAMVFGVSRFQAELVLIEPPR